MINNISARVKPGESCDEKVEKLIKSEGKKI